MNHQNNNQQHNDQQAQGKALAIFKYMAAFWPQMNRDYPTDDHIRLLCKSWAPLFAPFENTLILSAVDHFVMQGEAFAPITKILDFCRKQTEKITGNSEDIDKETAFLECLAALGNPSEFDFSHPVIRLIYGHAGGQHLFSQQRRQAWPFFEKAFLECTKKWTTREAAEDELHRRHNRPAIGYEPTPPTPREIEETRRNLEEVGIDPDDPKAAGLYALHMLRKSKLNRG